MLVSTTGTTGTDSKQTNDAQRATETALGIFRDEVLLRVNELRSNLAFAAALLYVEPLQPRPYRSVLYRDLTQLRTRLRTPTSCCLRALATIVRT